MRANVFAYLDLPFELKRDLGSTMAGRLGDWIAQNPQAHIDALVEAGVLERGEQGSAKDWYRVIQPHKHEWRVRAIRGDSKAIVLDCACMVDPQQCVEVPNRLPIEVPE